MRYLIFLLLFISCKNDSQNRETPTVDSLINQNEELKKEINELKSGDSEKKEMQQNNSSAKYCYVLITYIQEEPGVLSGEDKTYITWSQITRIEYFDEDVKYRLMDEFENNFLATAHPFFKKIVSRECFAFDSYVEASKHLASKKSLE